MLNPDEMLPRVLLSSALAEAGFPVAYTTLCKLACCGGGPEYRLYNGRAFYRWEDALAWAKGRMSAPRTRALPRQRSVTAAVSDLIAINPMLPRL